MKPIKPIKPIKPLRPFSIKLFEKFFKSISYSELRNKSMKEKSIKIKGGLIASIIAVCVISILCNYLFGSDFSTVFIIGNICAFGLTFYMINTLHKRMKIQTEIYVKSKFNLHDEFYEFTLFNQAEKLLNEFIINHKNPTGKLNYLIRKYEKLSEYKPFELRYFSLYTFVIIIPLTVSLIAFEAYLGIKKESNSVSLIHYALLITQITLPIIFIIYVALLFLNDHKNRNTSKYSEYLAVSEFLLNNWEEFDTIKNNKAAISLDEEL